MMKVNEPDLEARLVSTNILLMLLAELEFVLVDLDFVQIGRKLTYSFASCRVTMGTYPSSMPGGGVTIKAGSISASFPIAGGAR